MQFELRFPNGERVPFETLNAEAANLWGIHLVSLESGYAYPPPMGEYTYDESTSWEEVVGSAIMHPQVAGSIQLQQTWTEVKESMFNSHLDAGDAFDKKTDDMINQINSALLYLKPFFHLVDLWQSKGYNPIRIK